MEIPAEFRGRVHKLKTSIQNANLKFLDEIKKEFPGAEIGNLYEYVGPNKSVKEMGVIEFLTEEDYTAFMLRYGGNNV